MLSWRQLDICNTRITPTFILASHQHTSGTDYTLAGIYTIMLICKRVYSSEWERCKDMEPISVSYIPPREVKDSMLGGVHPMNSWVAAPSLTFQCIFTEPCTESICNIFSHGKNDGTLAIKYTSITFTAYLCKASLLFQLMLCSGHWYKYTEPDLVSH